MQAVLMVAGKSTRTYPLTLTRPKPLLPIANRALIYHSLDQMAGLFDEVILITGYKKEMIESELGDSYLGMRLVYQEQKEQLGTGHAVLQAKPYIKEKFVAMNGDDLFNHADLKELINFDCAALVTRVENPSLYGVFQVDGNNRVENLIEKPTEYLGDLANIGCYVLQPDFFDELEKTPVSERGEIEITSTVATIARQHDFYAVPIQGFWLPIGYAWNLLDHQEVLMPKLVDEDIQGVIEPGATIRGPVSVGSGTLVKAGSYLEGPVIIGRDCVIGPNCHIRKYTSIGDNCRIGNAVEVKNSIIMNDSQIVHLSYVGDSIVGKGCNLGAGTITANQRHDMAPVKSMIKQKYVDSKRVKLGSIIADEVKTGIHTSIYPGRKIWPGLTTKPGQIVGRDLTA